MNGVAVAALIAAGMSAATNWWALATGRRHVERIAKPLATALLVVVAATAGSPDATVRAALVVAVLFGLLGDVALLGDSEARFMAGLGAFAIGHTAYVVAALAAGVSWAHALIAAPFMAVLLGWRFLPQTAPGARRVGGTVLFVAVLAYAVIISAMVLTATGTRSVLAALGAMLFAVSDWVLGYDRFVRPVRHRDLAVMVPYHAGQALLIVGLATA
ncbi:MAG: lysoplasmalogenase [Ilumatobacteraceae bacterium]